MEIRWFQFQNGSIDRKVRQHTTRGIKQFQFQNGSIDRLGLFVPMPTYPGFNSKMVYIPFKLTTKSGLN